MTTPPPPTAATIALAWRKALVRFERAELAAGLSPATVTVRLGRLSRLAAAMACTPQALSPADVDSILEAITVKHHAHPATAKAERVAFRSFYRFTHAAGAATDALPPTTVTRARLYTLDQRWADALALFDTHLDHNAHTDSTVALRLKHLRRFAVGQSVGPFDISFEHITGFLDQLGGAAGNRLAHRTSLRSFYWWAFKSGRVALDPSAEPSRRCRAIPAPPAWEAQLRAFRTYLRALGRPETTVQTVLGLLGRFARGNASLAPFDATLDDIIEWLASQRWSQEYRRHNRNAIMAFYSWAVDTERIIKSPAAKLPVVKAGQPRPKPALDEEYAAALCAGDDRERLALRLGAELGMRRAEVAVTHSRDLRELDGAFSLIVHGKGDKDRTIPLPPSLARALSHEPAGYVFPGKLAGHISPHYLGKLISALLPAGVTMHALRHRFATRAYAISGDVLGVQQLLGHASPTTTMRYVKIADNTLRHLVEAASQ